MIEIALGIILAVLILSNLDIAIKLAFILIKIIVFAIPFLIGLAIVFAGISMVTA